MGNKTMDNQENKKKILAELKAKKIECLDVGGGTIWMKVGNEWIWFTIAMSGNVYDGE